MEWVFILNNSHQINNLSFPEWFIFTKASFFFDSFFWSGSASLRFVDGTVIASELKGFLVLILIAVLIMGSIGVCALLLF
jgi:hypothetical protein